MDDARFDGWTRRRFGLSSGGVLASLIALAAGADDIAANNKHKKCKQGEKRCGKRKCVKGDCCPGKSCGEGCECQRTVGGRTFCVDLGIKVLCEQCNSNADCEAPFHCVKQNPPCFGSTAICRPPCGFVP